MTSRLAGLLPPGTVTCEVGACVSTFTGVLVVLGVSGGRSATNLERQSLLMWPGLLQW